MNAYTLTDLVVAFFGGGALFSCGFLAPRFEDWLDRRRERRQTERLRREGRWS